MDLVLTIGLGLAMQGAVVGIIRDGSTGAPLSGAVVNLPDAERTTTTGAEGRYALHGVPAGPQHLSVRMIGYAPRSLHALVPPAGTLEIDVSLRAIPLRLRTVEVSAPVIVRGLDAGDSTAFPDRGVSMAAASNHPLLSEPDALQALAGGEVVVRPESPSGVHVRGGASDHTAYVLDGIPILNPYHAAGMFGAWSPDALSRVQLSSSGPAVVHPHALSGTIAGTTRAPGDRIRGQGGASTTHARLTLDGPLGVAAAGFLASIRSGFPGVIARRDEASYLHGELGDWLIKIEAPLLGGRARWLGYANENELDAASGAEMEGAPSTSTPRNQFAWSSGSNGVEWSRTFARTTARMTWWSVSANASALWGGADAVELTAGRRDEGVVATLERSRGLAGIRVERVATGYRVMSRSSTEPIWAVDARTPVVSAFAQRALTLHDDLAAELGVSVATVHGVHVSPRVLLRWSLAEHLTVIGSYAQTHQFAQSLRNAESVVGNVFPADLYVGAGASGTPVARSDHVVAGAEYRPSSAFRVSVQGYTRTLGGLVVVASRSFGPFGSGTFATGSGGSRGASADLSMRGARYGLTASYGWQHVRLRYGDSSYVPEFATGHLFDGGVVVFPSATTSVRVGATGGIGRRTSVVAGGLEWESCNLLDQGCELAGSPHNEPGRPGATALPPYLRVDVSIRKHWHLELGRRDVMLALFGTVTNVFDRQNVLTYARDPSTGTIHAIGMRPLAPLVVGLDWRF